MKINQKILSEETTLCGFPTKDGDSRYLVDICFHRKINLKEAASKNIINIENLICVLNLKTDLTSERYTGLGGDCLLKFAKQVDGLTDSLEDIFAIHIKDVCGSEKLFIEVRFDGQTFKRATNYPGDAPTMKLMEATESMMEDGISTIN